MQKLCNLQFVLLICLHAQRCHLFLMTNGQHTNTYMLAPSHFHSHHAFALFLRISEQKEILQMCVCLCIGLCEWSSRDVRNARSHCSMKTHTYLETQTYRYRYVHMYVSLMRSHVLSKVDFTKWKAQTIALQIMRYFSTNRKSPASGTYRRRQMQLRLQLKRKERKRWRH